MFRYYIFDIKNKFKNDDNLFRLLKTLYTLNLKYINYGELLYNEVCKPIERYKIEEILIDYHAKKVSEKYFICLKSALRQIFLLETTIFYIIYFDT